MLLLLLFKFTRNPSDCLFLYYVMIKILITTAVFTANSWPVTQSGLMPILTGH